MGALEVGHENFGICAKNQNMNEECFGCFEPFYSNSKLSGCFFFFLFFYLQPFLHSFFVI